MMTQGIQAMGEKAVQEIMAKIRAFSDFNKNNDPHKEHDMGKFTHNGETILFKLDYYDKAMEYASPDPADPNVTTRVMTIMTGFEY